MAQTKRVIFHIDMDAFFASCAELKNPTLKKIPVVIGYNSFHAIVITANYPARKYGIKTAMPLQQAKKLCPNLTVVEPDYNFYSLISKRIWNLLEKNFSQQIEILSIDECFLDVTIFWRKYQTPRKMAFMIQETIQNEIGIGASIGISYNKFLAKMASDLQKPKGITIISPKMLEEKLWPLPIEKMYGVGIATNRVLKNKFAVQSIGDLVKTDPYQLEKELGKVGLSLLSHALGNGDNFVNSQRNLSKTISNEITLESGINHLSELEDLLLTLTKNNLLRLKKQDLLVKSVSVYLRYQRSNYEDKFDKLKHLKHQSKQLTFPDFTNDFEEIIAEVKDCFNILYELGKIVTLIGVSFNKLKNNDHSKQLSFNDSLVEVEEQNLKINHLIRQINQHFKNKKILFADQWENQEYKYSKHFEEFVQHDELRKKK